MFDATLLDSSPERMPVLTGRHWLAALLVGSLAALAAYLVLPAFSTPSPKAQWVESILLGVAVMFYELMIWYVLADARHLGLSAWKWAVALLLLNVVGFVGYLIYSAVKTGEWKRATLPLAYIFQGLVVCVLLLIPLVSTQALPDQHWILNAFIPSPPPGPSPASRASHVRTARTAAGRTEITEPPVIPARITRVHDEPDSSSIAPSNFPGVIGGVFRENRGDMLPLALLGTRNVPPPPLGTPPPAVRRIRKGGEVQAALLIFHPAPQYPEWPRRSRIQGTVLLEAIISKEGTIENLRAISGHPLLIPAALDAVRRWRYQPTLLNREPVEVVTQIEVNFRLDE